MKKVFKFEVGKTYLAGNHTASILKRGYKFITFNVGKTDDFGWSSDSFRRAFSTVDSLKGYDTEELVINDFFGKGQDLIFWANNAEVPEIVPIEYVIEETDGTEEDAEEVLTLDFNFSVDDSDDELVDEPTTFYKKSAVISRQLKKRLEELEENLLDIRAEIARTYDAVINIKIDMSDFPADSHNWSLQQRYRRIELGEKEAYLEKLIAKRNDTLKDINFYHNRLAETGLNDIHPHVLFKYYDFHVADALTAISWIEDILPAFNIDSRFKVCGAVVAKNSLGDFMHIFDNRIEVTTIRQNENSITTFWLDIPESYFIAKLKKFTVDAVNNSSNLPTFSISDFDGNVYTYSERSMEIINVSFSDSTPTFPNLPKVTSSDSSAGGNVKDFIAKNRRINQYQGLRGVINPKLISA